MNGWKLVPVEPTETMIICGFESEPDECFSDEEDWAAYQEMSGCQQAAHKAKLCWAAMLEAAPQPPSVGDLPSLPERVEIEHPRSQPNSWDDWGLGFNACRKESKPAITARDQQIAELTKERDMYRADKETMRRYNNEANEQIAAAQARIQQLEAALRNVYDLGQEGLHDHEAVLAALAQQVTK